MPKQLTLSQLADERAWKTFSVPLVQPPVIAAHVPCERCGKRACCVDMYGTPLCSRCLRESVKAKALRWLRMASPRPKDSILLVSRGDIQSFAALKIVYDVERNYDVTFLVLEVGSQQALQSLCEALGLDYTFARASYETYTGFRLSLIPCLSAHKEALVALPDTIEDLAAYALGEVFLGRYEGLELEARYRVAYPLGAVSLKELYQLFPGELAGTPFLFESSRAREVVEWAMRISPTLCNSTVRALLEVIEALSGSKIFKQPLRRV